MSLINDYTIDIQTKQHVADLHEIADMDRLAGQLAPQSSLQRYARQHGAGRVGLRSRIVAALTGRRHHAV